MAHLKFRAAQRRKGRESKFKALLAPASNYFCIAFLGLILALMCTIDGMRLSAILLPVWILFLFIAFKLLRRPAARCPPSGGAACLYCDPLRRRRICLAIFFFVIDYFCFERFCNRLLF